MSGTLRLRGGRVIDPANGVDAVRDIGVRDGRIVELHPKEAVGEDIDASGCVVMAGGIDMHTHIGGGKVNLARHAAAGRPSPRPRPDRAADQSAGAGRRCGHCRAWHPGTPATATPRWATRRPSSRRWCIRQRAARAPGDGRHTDRRPRRLRDARQRRAVPRRCCREGERLRADPRLRRLRPSMPRKSIGVKMVNPGGISAFKFNQRKLDLDEKHVPTGG